MKERIATVFDGECHVEADGDDGHIIWIAYPHDENGSYLLPRVKLEIGPLAAWVPHQAFPVMPYVGEAFPQLGIKPFDVPTILAERTFWEKVTILHQEHFRPEKLAAPSRFSRHYYDLFKMSLSEVCRNALANTELLRKVVDFKRKFYPRAWARYDLAIPGEIRLMPPKHSLKSLVADYGQMKEMIFGDYPKWEERKRGSPQKTQRKFRFSPNQDRSRDLQEKVFDILKNSTGNGRLRVSDDGTLKGRLLIAFVAVTLHKALENKLREAGMLDGTTVNKALDLARKFNVLCLDGARRMPLEVPRKTRVIYEAVSPGLLKEHGVDPGDAEAEAKAAKKCSYLWM